MKSVKPGRGPSFLSGIIGIFMTFFGIVWTFAALLVGRSIIMAIFGVGFVIIVFIITIYNFVNAVRKNRYSVYDVVPHHHEPDPLNLRYHQPRTAEPQTSKMANSSKFCPYCGSGVQTDHRFCHQCGSPLP